MSTRRLPAVVLPPEGDLHVVQAGDRPVAVTVVDGQVYAFDALCTHAQCSLSEGDIDGKSVVCPCHFGRFDITSGAVLGGPPKAPLRTYPARVVGGALELDI